MDGITMSKEQNKVITETLASEQGKLFNFIKKRVNVREDAEDILQDVFFQLVNVYESIGSIDKVTSWLYKVANNKIIDGRRKKRAELYDDHANEKEVLMLEAILPDLSNSPEDILLQDLIWEAIQEALTELPVEQRQTFIWHEFEDLSFAEISSLTGISENTLFSRKRYAINYLRKRLRTLYKEL